jgi:hypothetical protein
MDKKLEALMLLGLYQINLKKREDGQSIIT